LRLCETLSLGEKRFVAVIQFETQQFLVGGSARSVNLLARLGESPDFPAMLTEWCERQR
jgi:flagellar biogenesis protein FliO